MSQPAKASPSDAQFILWNVFPWHPHRPGEPMSNRKPTAAEVRAGCQVLRLFLDWLRPEQIIAVGRIAERALREMKVDAHYVRHPSHGGQRAFQRSMLYLPSPAPALPLTRHRTHSHTPSAHSPMGTTPT